MSNFSLTPSPARLKLLDRIKQQFNIDTLLFLDWETYFKTKGTKDNKSFSLKSKPYHEYIFDEQFHPTGLGFAFDLSEWTYVHRPEDIERAIDEWKTKQAQGMRIGVVAHNNQFDSSINYWRYGFKADYYFCTKLIRALTASHRPSSLRASMEDVFPDDDTLRKGDELSSYDGLRYGDVPLDHQNPNNPNTLAAYCVNDNHIMRELFFGMLSLGLPQGELELMHITLRADVEPQFKINRQLLSEVVRDESENKAQAVKAASDFCERQGMSDITKKTFSSNDQYEALLERFDITVPEKLSPQTHKMTPALGKNDPEYIRMQLDHPDLKTIYKARKEVKSTIAVSRANRMIKVSKLFEQFGFIDADLPFFLKYYGADKTGRWSAGEKLNQQNNPNGSKHRLSHETPDGYLLAVNDLSNIELRVNLWFCEQNDILEKFATDPNFDAYSDFASEIYGYPVNKKDHHQERQVGKAGKLGLGFAMGWLGFQNYLASGPLGMEPMFVSDTFAMNVKNSYEYKHPAIKGMWQFITNHVLPILANNGTLSFGRNNCVTVTKDELHLPGGRVLRYPNTRVVGEETQTGFRMQYVCDDTKYDRHGVPLKRFLHRGLIIENIIQALARDILAWQIVQIENQLNAEKIGHVVGSVHDEILALLRKCFAEKGFSIMQEVMSLVPQWAKGIPLASEGGIDTCYSK